MPTDLSLLDLRRRSLAGARLALASLAGSDVRGTDFSGADLRGADFSRVRTGMSRGWTTVLVLCSLVLSICVGAFSGVAGNFLHVLVAADDPRRRAMGLFIAAGLLVYLVVGIWKGLRFATRNVLPAVAALAVAAGVVGILSGTGSLAGTLAVVAFVFLAAAIVVLSVFARAVAGTAGNWFFVVVAVSGAMTGRAFGGGLTALAIAVGAMLMARRSATRQDDFPLMARISTAIACRRGTVFRGADLTGAHFDGAELVACDFRGAELAGAHFADVRVIRLCRFDRVPARVVRAETARAASIEAGTPGHPG